MGSWGVLGLLGVFVFKTSLPASTTEPAIKLFVAQTSFTRLPLGHPHKMFRFPSPLVKVGRSVGQKKKKKMNT